MGPVAQTAAGASLVALVLLMGCVDQVEQNEYGLVFNWVSKTIDSKVYHGGTHFVGFWNKFITFPATVQTIEFSERPFLRTTEALHTRTKEGLGLHLSISFQYQLIAEEIPQLYALTNQWYESLFTRIARDQLLEAASEYEGPQYWMERKRIGDHMRGLVDEALKSSHAKLWGLQLLIIDLPNQYELSITMTQVQQQLVKTRKNQQLAASIRADTEVLQAEFDRQISVVKAAADANYMLVSRLAEAEATKRRILAEADALKYVRKDLKLSPEGAVEYQQLSAYAGLQNATFLANVGVTPVISAGAQPAAAAAAAGLLQRRAPSTSAEVAASSKDDGTAGAASNAITSEEEFQRKDAFLSFFRGSGLATGAAAGDGRSLRLRLRG